MTAISWKLSPTCRVRKEPFGLLFYDSRGPKLLFAETGSMVPPDFFTDRARRQRYLAGMGAREQQRMTRFIDQLVQKGFVHEQPIC